MCSIIIILKKKSLQISCPYTDLKNNKTCNNNNNIEKSQWIFTKENTIEVDNNLAFSNSYFS